LELIHLVELNLLQFAQLLCDFKVRLIAFAGCRIGEYLVQLDHRVLKCLELAILGLHLDKKLISPFNDLVNNGVQVLEAGILRVKDLLSRLSMGIELCVHVIDRLQVDELSKRQIRLQRHDVPRGY
jgi:hypothetical protein